MKMKTQLCWDCKNCRADKCSWHDGTYTPVPGWDAEPEVVRNRYQSQDEAVYFKDTDSFWIKGCPNFMPDRPIKTTKGIQDKFNKLFSKIDKLENRLSILEKGDCENGRY